MLRTRDTPRIFGCYQSAGCEVPENVLEGPRPADSGVLHERPGAKGGNLAQHMTFPDFRVPKYVWVDGIGIPLNE
jgi:hypothetical protein